MHGIGPSYFKHKKENYLHLKEERKKQICCKNVEMSVSTFCKDKRTHTYVEEYHGFIQSKSR